MITLREAQKRNRHRLVFVAHEDMTAYVDAWIADDILMLWQHLIPTFASCQGDVDADRYVKLYSYDMAELACSLLPWAHAVIAEEHGPDVIPYPVWAPLPGSRSSFIVTTSVARDPYYW